MILGIENHLLHSTRVQWQFGHIRRSDLIFVQNVSELAFCISKEKIQLFFFQKSKIDIYMAQIDPALSEMKNQAPKHISTNLSIYTTSKIWKKHFYAIFMKESSIIRIL